MQRPQFVLSLAAMTLPLPGPLVCELPKVLHVARKEAGRDPIPVDAVVDTSSLLSFETNTSDINQCVTLVSSDAAHSQVGRSLDFGGRTNGQALPDDGLLSSNPDVLCSTPKARLTRGSIVASHTSATSRQAQADSSTKEVVVMFGNSRRLALGTGGDHKEPCLAPS